MKIRTGYVSNSSSSNFVVFKDALSNEQLDMILNYKECIESFILLDEENNNKDNIKEKFEYYKTDPWTIAEHEDFIFGDTSMDNFGMPEYFEYVNIPKDYVMWDDGWDYEPNTQQIAFIQKIKQKYRKDKLDKINNTNN